MPKFSSRTPYAETFMCARSLPDFSIVSLCIMQLCEYVFPIGFPLYVPKNVFLGGFEGEDVKILCSDPRKALPCMNMCLLVCIACQNRFSGLSSRSVEKFCVERKKFKKLSGNFGYMGSSIPWGDLDQMSCVGTVGRYGGRNHVCNIW